MDGPKIIEAKKSAKIFIEKMSSDTDNKIAIITFENTAELVNSFSNDFNQLKTKVDGIKIHGGTCIQCGVQKAGEEIAARGRPGYKKVVILLTDGRATKINGKSASNASAESAAFEAVKTAVNTNKIVFYTIGLGSEGPNNFLNQVASLTGGQFYFAPAESQLNEIYIQIAKASTKGSIVGFVFNDENKNAAFDPNESKLPGWSLTLLQPSSNASQAFSTDADGAYNIANLCDGEYALKLNLKPGTQQTTPVSQDPQAINITGGSALTDKNFGIYEAPAPTTPPNATTFFINSLIDGIGARGDNSNPDGSFSNKQPATPIRNLKISIFNAANQLVAEGANTINYSSTSGMFTGKIIIPQALTSGSYTIKAATDNHLTRLLPGIQTIKAGQNNQLPTAIFTAGDIINDNKLDILDYNSLIDCYSDLQPPSSCSDAQKKKSSDLNDDGPVNQFDYNLFLREIASQPGQ
jgi:uncharacterized protein YegL